jgi:transcription initiation factor TFIID subunit TAF12
MQKQMQHIQKQDQAIAQLRLDLKASIQPPKATAQNNFMPDSQKPKVNPIARVSQPVPLTTKSQIVQSHHLKTKSAVIPRLDLTKIKRDAEF